MEHAIFKEHALFRILYCSRNCSEDLQGQQAPALSQIFQTARVNNKESGVTGALLFSAGYFAQVLEGPKGQIEKTFERIQRDPRHTDVTVLECSDIVTRDFPEWSMARVRPMSEVQAHLAGDALQGALGQPELAGQDVLELLRNLVVQDD